MDQTYQQDINQETAQQQAIVEAQTGYTAPTAPQFPSGESTNQSLDCPSAPYTTSPYPELASVPGDAQGLPQQPLGEPPADSISHIELGKRGERAAAAFLERHGYDILDRNWTCPAGEVDIVARDDYSLHFVEVKTRRGTGRGFPEEAVDDEKRARYERIAEFYLSYYGQTEISVHFDIISIVVTGPDRAFLRMHNNAFCFS